MLLYPRSTTLREEPFWGTGLAKASCLHFTHGWPSQFQMQLKTQEAFVIDQGHDASSQRVCEAGYQVSLVTSDCAASPSYAAVSMGWA